jgi:hypothetical protein
VRKAAKALKVCLTVKLLVQERQALRVRYRAAFVLDALLIQSPSLRTFIVFIFNMNCPLVELETGLRRESRSA